MLIDPCARKVDLLWTNTEEGLKHQNENFVIQYHKLQHNENGTSGTVAWIRSYVAWDNLASMCFRIATSQAPVFVVAAATTHDEIRLDWETLFCSPESDPCLVNGPVTLAALRRSYDLFGDVTMKPPPSKEVEIFHNERWLPARGWSDTHLCPLERAAWSSRNGKTMDRDDPPEEDWEWISEWIVAEDWEYAVDFRGTYHWNQGKLDVARRRRHVRFCSYTLGSPMAAAMDDHDPPVHIDIEVDSTEVTDEYALYHIRGSVHRQSGGATEHTLFTRYSELLQLHEKLVMLTEDLPLSKPPGFPPKKMFKNLDGEFVEQRRFALQNYFLALTSPPMEPIVLRCLLALFM